MACRINELQISLNFNFCLQKQKTVGRTKVLLETLPVHRLADIFVASFEISFEEQLSMLDSVDLKVRLSKATELVDRHLQVNAAASRLDLIDSIKEVISMYSLWLLYCMYG